ncbi:hypothetical protein Tco_1271220 [Tanacetum coccineum]
MCKAYGFKPTLNAFRRFFNLCPAGDWLTFSKRGEADVPYLFIKPFTNIRAGKGKFFYIQYTIVPAEYTALVDKANMDDRKFFKDPLPYIFAKNTDDPDDPNAEEKQTLVVGSSGIRDRVRNKKGEGSSQARPSSKIKMQLPTPVSRTTRQKVMMLPTKMSKGKASALKNLEVSDDEKDPHGLPSIKELHDALACRIMVEQVTLRAWTNIMEGMSLEKLLDLHDNGYTLQVVVDNHLNDKVREMIKFYKETKKDLGVVTGREASLKAKYDGAVVGLDENPVVVNLREELKSLEGQHKEHEANYSRFLLEEKKWVGQKDKLVCNIRKFSNKMITILPSDFSGLA